MIPLSTHPFLYWLAIFAMVSMVSVLASFINRALYRHSAAKKLLASNKIHPKRTNIR